MAATFTLTLDVEAGSLVDQAGSVEDVSQRLVEMATAREHRKEHGMKPAGGREGGWVGGRAGGRAGRQREHER